MVAVAAMAVSCTLLIPLDYTGGTEPARASRGGQSGTGTVETGGMAGEGLGGTLGEAGMSEGGQAGAMPEGGVGNEAAVGGTTGGTAPSTGGDTAAGTGGTPTGGDTGMGGTGDVGGGASGGTDATGGMESGGGGGMPGGGMGGGGRGGRGGRGGLGGMSGMSGSGVAGNADCPDADLSIDPMNCGRCGHACGDGIVCENSVCVTSPCAGLTCASAPLPMPMDDGERYKANNIGKEDVCYEVTGYAAAIAPKKPSIISWNFTTAPPVRKLEVNGVSVMINIADPGYGLTMPERAGGYCIHATAGDFDYAGVKLPYPGQLQ